jgi:DNA polymerase III gamma/tau subunit
MMPSAIPARLQFQCGHAALVTLPRVKGESASQRNDRVAREKSAALSRQCDFCAPANGTNHVNEVLEVEIPMNETSPVELAAEDTIVLVEPVASLSEAEDVSTPEAAETLPSEEPADDQPAMVEAVPVEELVAVASVSDEPAEIGQPEQPKPARKPRGRRQPSPAEVARGQRFLVEYRLERVLRADTIHDALRQLASLGAADVVAITREDF